MEYFAHKAEDGRTQTVQTHLTETGELCAAFAAEFGAGEYGKLVGQAHDIGKCTPEFQRRLDGGPKVDHATAGALACAKENQMLAALCVAGHHGGLPDYGSPADQPGDPTLMGRLRKGITEGRLSRCRWNQPLPAVGHVPAFQDNYALSLWTRMLYSCLVDADYLNTEQFMAGGAVQRGDYAGLPTLLDRLRQYIRPWFPPKTPLNEKRCAILDACLQAGPSPRGIYTLTVPTGGGKTAASLAFALRHGVEHQMQRVIYVIPYTSIIEQNAEVFRTILGAENVIEHHTGALFDGDGEIQDAKSRQRLACENWDAPVIVTTSVQFFESLYANRPSKCRKLHNIANSVIIFDEAQMLPAPHLAACVGAIANLVANFRATAVLCTATQPVLGDLIRRFAPHLPVTEICPNTGELYRQFRRVTFRNGGRLSNLELALQLSGHRQVLCIVNTRKAAQEIYALLPEEGSYHLSTLMYPAHRQAVLNEIRERLAQNLPCRLVSTSLIEAGVDISFPAVYRELAGLDSILQAAGRCNREGKETAENSIVTWFTGEAPPPRLFGTSIGATREVLADGADPGDPETIRRYFTAYRSLLGDNLDKSRAVAHLRQGVHGCSLPFATVASDFHFIDQATRTVYIPQAGGEGCCRDLQAGIATRALYRKAGLYSVNIYGDHYQALLAAGDIQPLNEESGVLTNPSLYRQNTGLSLQAEFGKALFPPEPSHKE